MLPVGLRWQGCPCLSRLQRPHPPPAPHPAGQVRCAPSACSARCRRRPGVCRLCARRSSCLQNAASGRLAAVKQQRRSLRSGPTCRPPPPAGASSSTPARLTGRASRCRTTSRSCERPPRGAGGAPDRPRMQAGLGLNPPMPSPWPHRWPAGACSWTGMCLLATRCTPPRATAGRVSGSARPWAAAGVGGSEASTAAAGLKSSELDFPATGFSALQPLCRRHWLGGSAGGDV